MNHMAEVAKILGVELDEDFKCNESPCTYRITKCGALCDGVRGEESLMMLLYGTLTVKQKPWKPKIDERFYVVTIDGGVMYRYWDDCSSYKNYYKLGNFYRTYAEAEANRDKWISFYASDEVLEV